MVTKKTKILSNTYILRLFHPRISYCSRYIGRGWNKGMILVVVKNSWNYTGVSSIIVLSHSHIPYGSRGISRGWPLVVKSSWKYIGCPNYNVICFISYILPLRRCIVYRVELLLSSSQRCIWAGAYYLGYLILFSGLEPVFAALWAILLYYLYFVSSH